MGQTTTKLFVWNLKHIELAVTVPKHIELVVSVPKRVELTKSSLSHSSGYNFLFSRMKFVLRRRGLDFLSGLMMRAIL